jgi:hypothetical protein
LKQIIHFSTSHDFKVAKILAHDLIQVYLEDKLIIMENKDPKEKSQVNPKLKTKLDRF